MLLKNKFAVDFHDSYVKVMYGNTNRIKSFDMINIPHGIVDDYKIIDTAAASKILLKYIKENNVKSKNIYFCVNGQDVMVRQMEIPVMNKKNIIEAVKWDISQYLPVNGENHYIDFEILDRVLDDSKKVYKLFAVAVDKERVEKLLELSKILNMNLKVIDSYSNSIARTFKKLPMVSKEYDYSIGLIEIGISSSSITILESAKPFVNKTVPFGMNNIIKQISRMNNVSNEEAENFLTEEFDFNNMDEKDSLLIRIQTLLENVFSSFAKVIQFYATGKVNKKLNELYVIGSVCHIKGIREYISNYFDTVTYVVNKPKDLNLNVKTNCECNVSLYLSTLGLLLRKE